MTKASLAPTALALAAAAALQAAAAPRLTLHARSDVDERAAVVTSVALSSDGRWIAAACDDHAVRVWDAGDGEPVETLTGHADWVRAVRFAPAGGRLATVADDQTLRLWRIGAASSPTARRLTPTEGPLRAVAIRPDGLRIATVGFGTPLRVYDAAGTPVATFACPCEDTRAVAFSDDGRWVATGGRDGRVRLWDLDRDGLSVDLPGDGRRVRSVVFAPGSGTLAAAGDGPAVRLWTIEPVGDVISPSLPSVGSDAPMREVLTRPGKTHALAFVTPRLLAVGGTAEAIRVYDIDSGSPRAELSGHTGTVASLAASRDGRTLVSGSFDTTVRVWAIDEGLLGGRFASRAGAETR